MANASTDIYQLRSIGFKGERYRICLQSKNGPCPLLGLANVLILRGLLSFHADVAYIAFDSLIQQIANVLLDRCAGSTANDAATTELNVEEFMETLAKLNHGLDVNVKFGGVESFEYTKELVVFDMLNVQLVHGWVCDSSSPLHETLHNLSYNHLAVMRIDADELLAKGATGSEAEKAQRLVEWMDRTAAQLTFEGLIQLRQVVRDQSFAVLFRNNHFSTIYRCADDLFSLSTDEAFAQTSAVWERLDMVDGDVVMVDGEFCNLRERAPDEGSADGAGDDARLAAQLQQEEDHALALAVAAAGDPGAASQPAAAPLPAAAAAAPAAASAAAQPAKCCVLQ